MAANQARSTCYYSLQSTTICHTFSRSFFPAVIPAVSKIGSSTCRCFNCESSPWLFWLPTTCRVLQQHSHLWFHHYLSCSSLFFMFPPPVVAILFNEPSKAGRWDGSASVWQPTSRAVAVWIWHSTSFWSAIVWQPLPAEFLSKNLCICVNCLVIFKMKIFMFSDKR